VVTLDLNEKENLKAVWAQRDLKLHRYFDPDAQTAEACHIGWLPRAYALDQQGRVRYVQAKGTTSVEAAREIAALWDSQR